MVGNTPNFTKIDVLRCMLRFGKKNVARHTLTNGLELGEGTIRTILDGLKAKNVLDSTKKGHFLSKKGEEILNGLSGNISMPKEIRLDYLYPELKKIGVVVKNSAALEKVYVLRDIAVKSGAEGAVIFRFENKLYAPESDYVHDYGELESLFGFNDNDVLVVAFAKEKRNAENGALAIAIELNSALKKFINEV